MNVEKTMENLRSKGYKASWFASGAEAAEYVTGQLSGVSIGIGGSKTVEALGLYERLSEKNCVFWHWRQTPADEVRLQANAAEVYICSANGLAETGEIVNIDGSGNRLAATLYGKKKVFILVGINKIEENFEKALWRARNIASPLNARRFNVNTPCVKGELRCYDCDSPERICKALLVLWRKPNGVGECEVVIIGENLGY